MSVLAFSRRSMLRAIHMLGASSVTKWEAGATVAEEFGGIRMYPSQSIWQDEPPYTPAREGYIEVDGAKLWYQDGGGTGVPIVLLHASTGSAASWRYQQHRFATAGYRVIVYSRRGYYRSTIENPDVNISGADDLLALSQALELPNFHLLGTAVGGFASVDFALSYPERLRSLVIASSLGGIDEPEFVEVTRRLLTPEVMALPSYIKELGPSYRAINPHGTRRWIELEKMASEGKPALQPKNNRVSWDSLKRLPPTMFLTGDADLYMPPALFTLIRPHVPGARFVVIAEAGHSTSWEQPNAFNSAVLSFVEQH